MRAQEIVRGADILNHRDAIMNIKITENYVSIIKSSGKKDVSAAILAHSLKKIRKTAFGYRYAYFGDIVTDSQ